uniref:mitogen-activated protein kinase kinase n=1 Tax=Ditylenchus dipsaci TaxID=166011 RepID=A0A915ELP2_9BILA
MGLQVLICTGREAKQVEVDQITLMFFDMLMAELNAAIMANAVRLEHDYFEYLDEDGDAIAVRTDDELQSFLACYGSESTSNGLQVEPVKILLKSSRLEQKQMSQTSMNPSQIRPDDLKLLERLSDGQFGTVYKALDVKNDRLVAVKCIAIGGSVVILKLACKSPYIVEFYSAIFTDNELLICLELMDGLSLDLTGLLWASHIIHRDVKPSNFLINTKGDVKLADFGVSKQMAQSVAWSLCRHQGLHGT